MPAKWIHRFERKPGRWVFEPSPEARVEGAEVKELVEARWKPPEYYFHLRRGGHVAALKRHQRGATFIKVDIADFFSSVSRSRISRVLKEYFSHAEARRMATASTVQHPDDATRQVLPYGFIQSPLLASVALHKSALGKYLDELHRSRRLVVTVYVDDIIVSGKDPEELRNVLSELRQRALRSRLALSDEKEQGPASSISAFNIELADGAPLAILPKKLVEFRDVFQSSTSELQQAGIHGYVNSVNPTQAGSLR
jgi:hypothetical protein